MKKPRLISYVFGPDENPVLLREVLPIDWKKIWAKMDEEFGGSDSKEEARLQQLIEAQIRGEE